MTRLQTRPPQARAKRRFRIRQAGRWLWHLLKTSGSIVWESYARFARQRHLLFAAAISYYGIISLVPLIAIALTICGWLLQSEAATQSLVKTLAQLFPVDIGTFRNAAKVVSATSPWALMIYLFGLAWAGAYLFESIERVINAVCCQANDRAFHIRKIIGMTAATGAGILLLLSVAFGAAWATLGQAAWLPEVSWAIIGNLAKRAGVYLPLLTSTLVFILLYKFMPVQRPAWSAALAGGLFAGFSWEVIKWAFGVFLVFTGREYGSLYGSLANVVILMLWIHLSAVILILGAHISCIVQERLQPESVTAADLWLAN